MPAFSAFLLARTWAQPGVGATTETWALCVVVMWWWPL